MKRILLLVSLLWLPLASNGWSDEPTTTAPACRVAGSIETYHQTYREGFQPLGAAEDEVEARRLREMIEKLNNMTLPARSFERKADRPAAATVRKAAPAAAPPAPSAPPPPPAILSAEVLRELTQRVPPSVVDPIRLGDALYRSGHHPQALRVYREAIATARDPDDQAWLRYQIGVCLKESDPAEAKRYFQEVQNAASNGPWAELAALQQDLVNWMEQNQPAQFLNDLRRDLRELQDERMEESRQTPPRTGEKDPSTGSGAVGSAGGTAVPSVVIVPSSGKTPAGKKGKPQTNP